MKPIFKNDLAKLVMLLLGLVLLSTWLKLHGGSHNPFSILFLGIAGVAALILSRTSLVVFIFATLLSLWFLYSEVGTHNHMAMGGDYTLHLRGMWLANSLGVLLICSAIYYVRLQGEKANLENEKTQRVLAQIQRVDSLGSMIAQTAHQLNTPLGSLQLGLSELQEENLPAEDRKRWYIDMQHALDQITKLISKLRQEEKIENSERVSIASALEKFVLLWSAPRKILVSLQVNSKKEYPFSFVQDLHLILTALLDNAFEAAKKAPKISVTWEDLPNANCLVVEDNGPGMNEKTAEHALEPLFTTKARGTGLGLYICHQKAKRYQGSVKINSVVGKGTVIKVVFNAI